jgi:hypothetical protein
MSECTGDVNVSSMNITHEMTKEEIDREDERESKDYRVLKIGRTYEDKKRRCK